jgi:hypothetical protein
MPDSHDNRRLRGNAFKEEQYPEVSELRCITIKIPDSVEFVAQLQGLIAMATKQFQYQNWNSEHAKIISSQWRNAYDETDWDGCMDCEDVQDCIETHEGTQDAIKNVINNYLDANNQLPIGEPIPDSRSNYNLATDTNNTCDLDILWAQCLMVVKTTNDIIDDLLQKFEGLTNPAETFAAAASAIPVGGGTIAAIPNYIQLVQEFITENYAADYTTTPITGYEDMLACELFCVCKYDCAITIERFYTILLNRVIDRYDTAVPAISILNDLASYLVGIDVGGDQVADMAFLTIWGGLKLANFIAGGLLNRPHIGDGVISMWLLLAMDNPNPDWSIICEECPEYESLFYDPNPYPVEDSGLEINADGGTFTGGDNRVINTPFQAEIILPVERRVVTIYVTMAFGEETGNEVIIETVEYPLTRVSHLGGSTYVYAADIPNVLCQDIDFQFVANSETSGTFVVISMIELVVWEIE